jgi:XRE family aerobic/anaerobic benzoate catabolism transcriptional regulator
MDADPILAGLGRRARELRAAKGLTLKDVATLSGLSARFLVQVEAGEGNISVKRLAALAGALSTTPAALLDGADAGPDSVVALLGLRGAGKSTIGRKLARRLHVPLVELDRRIEETAGLSLAEIFDFHGEEYYRRLEREVLEGVLRQRRPLVLATGGGIVNSPETFAFLKRGALTVWLRAEPEEHWNRVIQQGDRRPMADNPQAMAELRRLLAAREPLYASATHTIDTSRLGVDEAVHAIEALVKKKWAAHASRDRVQANAR